jgi:malonyl-CoA O-methyltransferase
MDLSLRSRHQARVERLVPEEAYDLLAPSYDLMPNPLVALERDAMNALLPPLSDLSVADLGCGTGRYTAQALDRGARRVYAVDLSSRMAAATAGRYREDPRVRAIRGDMERLPLRSGAVDGIVSGLAVGYVARLDRALAEMARVLVSQGFALLSDLHPIGGTLGWERGYRLRTNGSFRRITVEHHPYSFETFFDLAFDAGLQLEELREVPVGKSVGSFVGGPWQRLRLRRLRHLPAVAVFLLRKE